MTHAELSSWNRAGKRRTWAVVVIAVAAFLAGILLMAQINSRADSEKQRADDNAAAYLQLCNQWKALGHECPRDPATLKGDPGPEGPVGPQGPPPTEAQILAAVAAVYQANPPAAGRTPTTPEVAQLVADYLIANPPQRGEPGIRGEQGPGPTEAQVLAAVEVWLAMHPLPVCPSGSHIEEYNPPLDKRTFLVCVKDEEPQSHRASRSALRRAHSMLSWLSEARLPSQ